MERWMFGAGDGQDRQQMRALGFTQLTDNRAELKPADVPEFGLWRCLPAFSRRYVQNPDEHLAVDPEGAPHKWFGSVCPTLPEAREGNLAHARRAAEEEGIAGILIDGCRFSSPASGKGLDSFFTCFCPRCKAKMTALGLDAERITASVAALQRLCRGQGAEVDAEGIRQWLDFRKAVVTEHIAAFVRAVHGVKPGLPVGIYAFSPAMAPWVGQDYAALKEAGISLFAPMIYRCWKDADGPACLNVELAAMARGLEQSLDPEAVKALLERICAIPIPAGGSQAIFDRGFAPNVVGLEVAKARMEVEDALLWPILQFEDEDLASSETAALAAGADGVAFFAWNQRGNDWLTKLDYTPDLTED